MLDRWATLKLQKDDLELIILAGIGGRLANLKDLPTRSPQFGFPLWGGEKTWIAPDKLWADNEPFSALDSGPYKITSYSVDHVAMASEICPISQLSVQRIIGP